MIHETETVNFQGRYTERIKPWLWADPVQAAVPAHRTRCLGAICAWGSQLALPTEQPCAQPQPSWQPRSATTAPDLQVPGRALAWGTLEDIGWCCNRWTSLPRKLGGCLQTMKFTVVKGVRLESCYLVVRLMEGRFFSTNKWCGEVE